MTVLQNDETVPSATKIITTTTVPYIVTLKP